MKDLPNRKSIRIPGYDYSKPGFYFVTIVTHERNPIFGDGDWPGEIKSMVEHCWTSIPSHYPQIKTHDFVIMPDHFHGIIEITDSYPERRRKNPAYHDYQKTLPCSLGSIVRGFKIGVTKCVHEKYPDIKVWQKNFHEIIITNKAAMKNVKRYIQAHER